MSDWNLQSPWLLWLGLPLFAVAVWWAATVGIIFACGRRSWRRPVFVLSSLAALAATALMPSVSYITTPLGAAAGFLLGIVAWGWFETSYYTGYVVGLDTPPCAPNCGGWRHFVHGVKANLFHELSIFAGFALVWAVTPGPNQVALWTFTIHWWMHQSAKLNVFFGVRNLNEEYLPEHLRRMTQFFSKRPINWFFPFSVTISTAVAHWLFYRAVQATDAFTVAANGLACTLMALAILEHWWLILPQPVGVWAWGLLSRRTPEVKPTVDVIGGFLGAGKTTLLRNLIPQLDAKTIVLVNEFADVGLDGARLREAKSDADATPVVEMAGGCLCCTLSRNVAATLAQLIRDYAPERILIEPSGAAALGDLLGTLHQPGCRELLGPIRVVAVVDGKQWLTADRAVQSAIEAYVEAAATVIVNKCDSLSQAELERITDRIARCNPTARMLYTSFGRISLRDLSDTQEDACLGDTFAPRIAFEQRAETFAETFDAAALQQVFEDIAAGRFGEVARAKGVFRTAGGWLRLEYAGRSFNLNPCAAAPESSLVVIGRELSPNLMANLMAAVRTAVIASPAGGLASAVASAEAHRYLPTTVG
ncbi:MAG: putative photosynthetic complex assembly protein PuhE [Chloracidobacterium sp.]|nr:putative photosynthetic complex assembly protein PuhE [Chloracidobacterium sp.]MDW8217391.1 putative photosynthetic complex assembly protein PuhE [Acidobacteriota bacterium]